MKSAVLALLLCFLITGGYGQSRQRLSMDLNWRFSFADTIGAEKNSFNDSKWRTLDLPHDWSIEFPFEQSASTGGGGGYLPTGIGWYRKHFVLPASLISKKIWIEFDGIYQRSDVWLNGHHLGFYPNGYMSFYYDLSPFIQKGENTISVRVDNSRQPNTRWYSGSGIYRHVWLNISNKIHISQWGTFITTPVATNASAEISIQTKFGNETSGNEVVVIRSVLMDPQGTELKRMETPTQIEAGKEILTEQKLNISSPVLWSPENPALYSIQSQILINGKIIDEQSTPFGIRDIKYDVDKGLLLNGKHVKLNGVCLHHDAGSVGSAVPESMWVRRLQILKEMGCNAIRTSHNPVAPEFLNICDSMGFLVQDEIFDEWKSGKVKFGYSNYFDQWSQHDLINFIHRDRNHPSIVMWSAGNEIGEQKQENGHTILKPLIETFHREDPSRLVTTGNDNIAADNGSARLPFLQMLDIVGYNYVDRWHERRELFYSIDRHDHPDWKMTGTESVSIPGVRGNYYGGAFGRIDSTVIRPANMASVVRAEQLWKFVSSHDYVIGDFMWTGIDYLGESRWPNKNAGSGVIDLCGFPKDGYYFYQSQWTEKPMIHIFPHWNWKGKEGKVIQVMAFTNCDSLELFVNGKSFGIKALEFPRQGNSGAWNRYDKPLINTTTGDLHLAWDVPYEPGVLKIIGRKGGKIALEEEIKTTGKPAAIRLLTDKKSVTDQRGEIAHIKIEAIDDDGNIVPDAGNLIQLKVEGAGNLIGFDNGNPADTSSMKLNERKLFNGLALAIVRPNSNTGVIRIRATSPGLNDAFLEIICNKSGFQIATVEQLKK